HGGACVFLEALPCWFSNRLSTQGGFAVKFILFFLLLLVATVSASPGDESFLQGAFDEAQVLYEKELTETTEPAAKRRVLLKLTGLAQARNDVAGIAKYGNSLEKALQGQDDPQVAMRL